MNVKLLFMEPKVFIRQPVSSLRPDQESLHHVVGKEPESQSSC